MAARKIAGLFAGQGRGRYSRIEAGKQPECRPGRQGRFIAEPLQRPPEQMCLLPGGPAAAFCVAWARALETGMERSGWQDMLDMKGMVQREIEQALLLTHTAFLGQVVRLEGDRVTLQPMTLAKDATGKPYSQPLVVAAPKLRGLCVEQGDVCLCVCCERDISMALQRKIAVPALRRHDLSDTVVVGVLDL